MRIGIDASNICAGGGITHLRELLKNARPAKHGIDRIVLWASAKTIEQLPRPDWLSLVSPVELNGCLLERLHWQQARLTDEASRNCDLLFVPGGMYLGSFRPFVTMFRNLLPFDPTERRRFPVSVIRLRYQFLRWAQSRSFRKASGLIFLNSFGRELILRQIGALPGKTCVIPHGRAEAFDRPPWHADIERDGRPFRVLYVSTINFYKHQWHVVNAVTKLRGAGYVLKLQLVGSAYRPALEKLKSVIAAADPQNEFIELSGAVPYDKLPSVYHSADAFVFASSCETFGQVLLEAMSSGLPIACSNRSGLPELLQDGGVYFDPENPAQIERRLQSLVDDPALRRTRARRAYELSQDYNWRRCADLTLEFLREVKAQTSA